MELKTPLYEEHIRLGGKIVPFAGYLLPVQYPTGVITEHMAVRTACGLFDVSHMGEATLRGPGALRTLNTLLTNDFAIMADGQARYSPMCNDRGGVVDDLLVYKIKDEDYLLVVNASNRHKDMAWIQAHLAPDTDFADISDSVAQIALQGPRAQDIVRTLCDAELLPVKYYRFTKEMIVADVRCLVSRTGYTGENGYELYCAPQDAPKLWNALLQAGQPFGLIPCGLGARDTLRLEAAMPLYGHEMNDDITPLETGLDHFVKMDTHDFIGKAAMLEKGAPTLHRVGLRMTGRGIAREQYAVCKDGMEVGHVTSGTHCPYLKQAVAMALVRTDVAQGDHVTVDVRGRATEAEVIALPFYKKA